MGWTADFGLSYGISPPHINPPYYGGKKNFEKKETKQGVVDGPFKIRLKTQNFMRDMFFTFQVFFTKYLLLNCYFPLTKCLDI